MPKLILDRRGRCMVRVCVVLAMVMSAARAFSEVQARPPAFFALSVPDLEASVKWYGENLGLTATRLPGKPEAKVAILRGSGLMVELVEHSKAADLEAVVP